MSKSKRKPMAPKVQAQSAPPPPVGRPNTGLNEIGRIGQRQSAGRFYEDFLPQFNGQAANHIFKEMVTNDDVIGAVDTAIQLLCRQVSWDIQPASEDEANVKCADFVAECLHDMEDAWEDVLANILSFLDFGWSYHEIVYKYRLGSNKNKRYNSKFNDGLIGWRKMPNRAQETLDHWELDEHDDVLGMWQMLDDGTTRYIPIEKALHFKTQSRKNDPQGKSIWRNAYISYYYKKRIREIEGIGIERDLAGLPVLESPEGVDIWADGQEAQSKLARCESLVYNIRRDATEGIALPGGWKLSLLNSGGQRQFDTNKIIDRYDNRIAAVGLADFVLMGHQQIGSFALAEVKADLFANAVGAFLDIIANAFNKQAIPRLIELNQPYFNGISGYPTLTHTTVSKPKLKDMGLYVKYLAESGLLKPGADTEDHLRVMAGLPEESSPYDISLLGGGDGTLGEVSRTDSEDGLSDEPDSDGNEDSEDGRS